MTDQHWLAARFDEQRPHLRLVAHRVLGSGSDADDAVQESWLRLARSDSAGIENLRAWLTTVVARISLDMLRSRGRRTHGDLDDLDELEHQPLTNGDAAAEVELADSVGAALMVVLEHLTPAERLAFVLHDNFGIPFDELGPMLERSPAAAKQLASRARQKVRGAESASIVDATTHRRVVEAFMNAARQGDLRQLLVLLDPDIVLDADAAAVAMGAPATTRGANSVAEMFSGRALGAELTSVGGAPGLAWTVAGMTKVAWSFYVDGDIIVQIDMHADPVTLDDLDIPAASRVRSGPPDPQVC